MSMFSRRNVLSTFAAGAAMLGLSLAASTSGQPDDATAKVGQLAPDFTLKDLDGKDHKLSDYTKDGKIVVLEWFNPDCPFVKKHHVSSHTMAEAYTKVKDDNIVWLAVNSGAEGKQGAGLDRNKKAKADYKIEYPILLDTRGTVGKAYKARTTPHMFVIAEDGTLIYAGAIDNNSSPSRVGDVIYPLQAIAQHKAKETVTDPETEPYGCSVKY